MLGLQRARNTKFSRILSHKWNQFYLQNKYLSYLSRNKLLSNNNSSYNINNNYNNFHNNISINNSHNNLNNLLGLIFQNRYFSQDKYPEHEVVGLPALSPSVEVSTIVEWKRKVGDYIEEDTTIASVQTDKAELDWKVVDGVYLAKILLEPGKQVPVGTPCVIFVEKKEFVDAFKNYTLQDTSSSTPTSSDANKQTDTKPQDTPKKESKKSALPPGLPEYKALGLPALSPTATDGAVVSWTIKEGDYVEEGSPMAEIQTDKSVVTFSATDEAYIAKLLVDPDPELKLPVGTPIVVLVEDKKDISVFKDIDRNLFMDTFDTGSPETTTSDTTDNTTNTIPETNIGRIPSIRFRYGIRDTTKTDTTPSSSSKSSDFIKASPYAKKLAKEQGINLSDVQTKSGPRDRIVASDLANVKKTDTKPTTKQDTKPAPKLYNVGDRSIEEIPISTMRQVIASRLSESKFTSPHFYVTIECEIDKLMAMRKDINENNENAKISVNDFIIKACALALRDVPDANQSWMDTYIAKYNYVDISVAVATPTGLITPIVKDADFKGLSAISNEVKDLAKRARDNKLLPNEFQGGTFTISNMGMYGIDHFTAIINPPQSCILAVSAAKQILKPDDKNGYKKVTVMQVCLSSDHRSVDGAVAAQWCNAFKKYIEYPAKLLL